LHRTKQQNHIDVSEEAETSIYSPEMELFLKK